MTKESSDIEKEIIEKAIQLKAEENEDTIRAVVCKFFGENCCDRTADASVSCRDSECLRECKELYLSKIFSRPQVQWDPKWELPIERQPSKEKAIYGLQCDKCHLSDSCYAFKRNHTCSIDWGEKDADLTPKGMLDHLIKLQFTRLARAQQIELVDGGVIDQNLSTEMERYKELATIKADMDMTKFSFKMEAQAPAGGGGGLLSKLFGNMGAAPQSLDSSKVETIDVPFTEDIVTEKVSSKRNKKE